MFFSTRAAHKALRFATVLVADLSVMWPANHGTVGDFCPRLFGKLLKMTPCQQQKLFGISQELDIWMLLVYAENLTPAGGAVKNCNMYIINSGCLSYHLVNRI